MERQIRIAEQPCRRKPCCADLAPVSSGQAGATGRRRATAQLQAQLLEHGARCAACQVGRRLAPPHMSVHLGTRMTLAFLWCVQRGCPRPRRQASGRAARAPRHSGTGGTHARTPAQHRHWQSGPGRSRRGSSGTQRARPRRGARCGRRSGARLGGAGGAAAVPSACARVCGRFRVGHRSRGGAAGRALAQQAGQRKSGGATSSSSSSSPGASRPTHSQWNQSLQ